MLFSSLCQTRNARQCLSAFFILLSFAIHWWWDVARNSQASVNVSCLLAKCDTSSMDTLSSKIPTCDLLKYSQKILIYLWRQTFESVFHTRQLALWTFGPCFYETSSEYTGDILNNTPLYCTCNATCKAHRSFSVSINLNAFWMVWLLCYHVSEFACIRASWFAYRLFVLDWLCGNPWLLSMLSP